MATDASGHDGAVRATEVLDAQAPESAQAAEGAQTADGAPETLTVRLDHDRRHRRRLMVTAETGERILIDLAQATVLRGGDRLRLSDGRTLLVHAQEEPVCDIHAGDALTLQRLAWHLGNRHTPTAILSDRLRIRPDHVLEDMVRRHGGRTEHLSAPFDPEAGAYGGAHAHAHEHGGGHAHGGAPTHEHGAGGDGPDAAQAGAGTPGPSVQNTGD